MHSYSQYFPVRSADDELDISSVLYAGLASDVDRVLLVFEGEEWTVGRMAAKVADLQQMLIDRGLKTGDRVALMMENSPDHIALIYALMLSGLVWVPVNTKLKTIGIEYLFGHCMPRLLIADLSFMPELNHALAAVKGIDVLTSTDVAVAPISGACLQVRKAGTQTADTLCIIYTSGTTGAPKGVIFTHRMMRLASEAACIVADINDTDRLFLWEPLCHIGGAQMLVVPFLVPVSLVVVTRFSVSAFWEQVVRGKCTQLHYLGGILDILSRFPIPPLAKSHRLRIGWGAGVSASAWQATREHLQIELRECYGMTEGASFATLNQTDKPGSIGKALPWLTVELLDKQGKQVAQGELGQIVVSSKIEGNFLPGYLNNELASTQMLHDGKLYTGDIARADADGDLYFVGRLTESMRVRGENVSAWEIERVFQTHPDVAAAAAIGVGSDIGEQEVLLYVQWRQGADQAFKSLAAWAASKLASYQCPRYYRSIQQFDLTPSERIRKHLLSKDIAHAWDQKSPL